MGSIGFPINNIRLSVYLCLSGSGVPVNFWVFDQNICVDTTLTHNIAYLNLKLIRNSYSSTTFIKLNRLMISLPLICTDVLSAYMIENSNFDALQISFI